MACVRDRKKKERENQPEKVKARKMAWRQRNLEAERERERIRSRERRAENPEKFREYLRQWRSEHREEERIRSREKYWRTKEEKPDQIRESWRRQDEKQRSSPRGRLENAVSSGVHRGIKRGAKASRSTFGLLGYSLDDLCRHLETLFQPGMSWENYGFRGWHIDHIRPLASFNYETPDDTEFKEAWALTNLQPLWWQDNLSKNAKWEGPPPANDNKPKKDAA